jgi:dTMP kinase
LAAGFFLWQPINCRETEGKKFVSASKLKRLFITFEGIDGCGKSSQATLAQRWLISQGYKVTLLREPGSTEVSERIRSILLDKKLKITDLTELFLYEAARAQVTADEIAPLLAKGQIVLCDRFYDSTTAYQGYGRKLDIKMIRSLHKVAVGEIVPDLTFLFDIDLRTAFARRGNNPDRLEGQSRAFFNRVRLGFLELARKERSRIKVVDASRSIDAIFKDVSRLLSRKLRNYAPSRRP